jgi:hypothetical protein
MTLTEQIDALDKMVADHATTAEIRSQIAFIGREVAALEADYTNFAAQHAQLAAEHCRHVSGSGSFKMDCRCASCSRR